MGRAGTDRLDAGLTAEQMRLVADNLGLARWGAARYGRMYLGTAYSDADACQDAFLGLCRAAQQYDATRARFSTFAAPFMRSAIQRGVGQVGGAEHRRAMHNGSKVPAAMASLDTPRTVDGDATLGDLLVATDDPATVAVEADTVAPILAVLDSLPRDGLDRLILDALCDVDRDEHYIDQHVADIAGVHVNTVQVRRRALVALAAERLGIDVAQRLRSRHGTEAGARAHYRRGEPACAACAAEAARLMRLRKGDVA